MKILPRRILTGIDGNAAVAEAKKLIARRVAQPARRAFLQRSLTLGGLSMLSGCSISINADVEAALTRISRFNDAAQGWLFDPNRMA
ncbi:MAG: molybdopterin-binding protein, partial [Rhodoferax sp.]|nr:molybdopterin-binding protein [Rhodoferax sp.]